MTIKQQAVILKTERALPADGWPSELNYSKRSNRTLWTGGRLLLFVYLQKQAANANNENTNLNQVRICNHHGQPSSRWIRGQEAALCQEGQPPAVAGSAESRSFPDLSIAQYPTEGNNRKVPKLDTETGGIYKYDL